MLPIHTILHPTDFSPLCDEAFRLACSLARDHEAHLLVVHVLPPVAVAYGEMIAELRTESSRLQAKDAIEKIQSTEPLVPVEHRLVEGNPPTEILRVAAEVGCDLIVMGTHGRTGLSRLCMGSVAEEVVRKALCPVLTVKAAVAQASVVDEEPVNV